MPAQYDALVDTLQRAQRAFQQNPTPPLSSVIRRVAAQMQRHPEHKERVMQEQLKAALERYRAVLLETATGDLMALQSGNPRQASTAASAIVARKAVLEAAKHLSAEQFTAALMEAQFIR